MKLKVWEVTIENDGGEDGQGYCTVKIMDEGDDDWLEIHGNETKAPYPLCLDSHEHIDYFCEKLHILLDRKLIPTGFIKE